MQVLRMSMVLLVLVLALLGCQSDREWDAMAQPVVTQPLEFDPTEKYPVVGWWTNGREMVHLDRNHGYALFDSTNRYHTPVDRGTWHQQSYRVLLFDTYDDEAIRRVPVNKQRGLILIAVDDLAPMWRRDAPPRVMEDELLGTWANESRELYFGDNLRYAYRGAAASSAPISGHSGAWQLEGTTLTLQPDTPTVAEFTIEVAEDAQRRVLVWNGSSLRKADDDEEEAGE